MLDYPYDLGTYRRRITTDSADAELWFNRGLMWTYGFHHEEAELCFKRALEEDSRCAMAYWGLAYIAGPNYNRPWELFSKKETAAMLSSCKDNLSTALNHATHGVETALIKALMQRYQAALPSDDPYLWSAEYAGAMRQVYRDFPNDEDVATLFADAMMNRHPWKLWDLKTGEPKEGTDTLEVKAVLEDAMERFHVNGYRHPGLLHLYIHLMEMSPTPEKALRAADDLRDLVPDAGHLPICQLTSMCFAATTKMW